MQNFEYRVADSAGKILQGTLSADSLEEAINSLRSKNLLIIEIKPLSQGRKRYFQALQQLKAGGSVSTEELYTFFRELSVLLKSGMPLDRSISVLIRATSNPHLRSKLDLILTALREGKTVTQAFQDAGLTRQSVILSMISAGESVGNLIQAFSNIADYLQFQIQLRREIWEALTYPLFLVVASFLSLFVIFYFILPKFFSLFGETSLPMIARVLLGIGYIFQPEVIITVLSLILFYLILKRMGYRIPLTLPVKPLILEAPVFRSLILYLDLARFSYAMHSMLKGGLDFIDSLYLAKNLVYNDKLRNLFESSIAEIRKGSSIRESLARSSVLPELFHSMISVGEETASLREMFYELYCIYDEKFKSLVRKILSLVEPVIILFTGLIIGFIVISLIFTVMSVNVIRL